VDTSAVFSSCRAGKSPDTSNRTSIYKCVVRHIKYTMMCQSNTTFFNFIMFIIVLGQHVSILTESSSGPSKKIDPYLQCLKMRYGIPNAYILDKTM